MEVPLPAELQSKLARLAAQQGRDAGSLVTEAVERMVDYDEWFVAEVEKGLADVQQNHTLDHEQMGVRLANYVANKQTHT